MPIAVCAFQCLLHCLLNMPLEFLAVIDTSTYESPFACRRRCPFQQRGGSDETFRKLLLHDPEAESKQLEQKLCRLFDAADTQKRGMLDMVDMKRMYKSGAWSQACSKNGHGIKTGACENWLVLAVFLRCC